MDSSQVKDILRDILNQDDFHHLGPSLWEQLGSWWRELGARIDINAPKPGIHLGKFTEFSLKDLPWVVICVAIVIIIILYIAKKVSQRQLNSIVAPQQRIQEKNKLSYTNWLALADEANMQHNQQSAMRYLYQAALVSLSEQGLFRLQPNFTGRDYIKLAKELPSGKLQALRQLTTRFEKMWYGHPGSVEKWYEESRLLLDQLTS